MEENKDIIAKNIIYYRKSLKLTQAELAEQLKYSDKAVSKWERGEALPDSFVLKQIAEILGVSMDTLCRKHEKETYKRPIRILRKKLFVPLLSVGIVWLVATIIFAFLSMFQVEGPIWLAFICAIPASCIVFLVFSTIWWNYWFTSFWISALIWTIALMLFLFVYLIADISNIDAFWFFVIAVPLQILAILWMLFKKLPQRLFKKRGNKNKGENEEEQK